MIKTLLKNLRRHLTELLIKVIEFIFSPIRERRLDLERALDTDELTKLANRAALNKARAKAEASRKMSFIVFDCNNFKAVNDHLGHAAGDDALLAVADEIRIACHHFKMRGFRYGGDEFVVLVPFKFAEAVRDRIEKNVRENDAVRAINEQLADLTFDKVLSISGTIGSTFEKADDALQARKKAAKAAQIVPLEVKPLIDHCDCCERQIVINSLSWLRTYNEFWYSSLFLSCCPECHLTEGGAASVESDKAAAKSRMEMTALALGTREKRNQF